MKRFPPLLLRPGRWSFAAVAVFLAPLVVHAQNFTTPTLAVVATPIPAGVDTIVTLSLQPPSVLVAPVQSVDGANITVATSAPLTPNQFASPAEIGPGDFALQIVNGANAGQSYPVIGNNASTIFSTPDAVNPGDIVGIVPNWQLNDFFPAGNTGLADNATITLGRDGPGGPVYHYSTDSTNSTAAWKDSSGHHVDIVLAPGETFTVHQPADAPDTQLLLAGVPYVAPSASDSGNTSDSGSTDSTGNVTTSSDTGGNDTNTGGDDSGNVTPTVTGGIDGPSSGPSANTKPIITTQPISVVVLVNQSATLGVVATGAGPLSYQWHKNGAILAGQTSSGLTITQATLADRGRYYVVVTNPLGKATSHAATLKVLLTAVKPTIVQQPRYVSLARGRNAKIMVKAAGTAPLFYTWQKDGVTLTNSGPLTGTGGPTLSITGMSSSNSGDYHVIVQNVAGQITSATVTISAP